MKWLIPEFAIKLRHVHFLTEIIESENALNHFESLFLVINMRCNNRRQLRRKCNRCGSCIVFRVKHLYRQEPRVNFGNRCLYDPVSEPLLIEVLYAKVVMWMLLQQSHDFDEAL